MPAAPKLSMKPTGWFQAGWSAEVEIGQIKNLRYFGQDLILWRDESGKARIMDAYCEHLGAHLGFGGRVSGENIVCPFHGWEWSGEGKNVCIPYQDRPNKARRIRTWPTDEKNEIIYIWHDADGKEPSFEVPDIFEAYEDGRKAEDYYLAYPECVLHLPSLPLHPQYVMENGVDFAHFKYVHRAEQMPALVRREFDDTRFYADIEMTFGLTKDKTVMTPEGAVKGGVNAINVGIGVGIAKFWGPDNMRTVVSVTPVDDDVSDIRSTVWLDRLSGDDSPHIPEKLERRMRLANNQFLADVNIWEHQRYTDPPALATSEGEGFRELRKWCMQWYPEGEVTAAVEPPPY